MSLHCKTVTEKLYQMTGNINFQFRCFSMIIDKYLKKKKKKLIEKNQGQTIVAYNIKIIIVVEALSLYLMVNDRAL